MVQSRRSAVALIAVVAFAVAFVAVEAHGFKFAVGNSLGNDIDVINTKSNRVTNLVKSTAGLISPDNMLRIPGKDRFIVSSGEELSNSALMIVDSNTGRVIGRFDDGKGPLYRPYGSAWAPNGDLIVSSFKGNQVLRYSSTGKYKGTVGTSDELLMGPNALLYGKDGLLYLTTEGSILINGTLQWNFNSQILRLKNNKWEIFSDDANRYGVIGVAYPNYLGLANSPVNDNLIFVSDYANGVLAFDLTTKVMKGRIETSFTGQPSTNALGALIFNPQPKNSRYEIFVPGFLPNQNNNGAILRLRFDQVSKMDKVRPAFEVAPTSRLNKPIAVIRV